MIQSITIFVVVGLLLCKQNYSFLSITHNFNVYLRNHFKTHRFIDIRRSNILSLRESILFDNSNSSNKLNTFSSDLQQGSLISSADDSQSSLLLHEIDTEYNKDFENDMFTSIIAHNTHYDNDNLEKCIIVAVDSKSNSGLVKGKYAEKLTLQESLQELAELVKTAGLRVMQLSVQRLQNPSASTYIGTGKVREIAATCRRLNTWTLIFDDDLSMKQQRNLEDLFSSQFEKQPCSVKILDRTAVILEIFAQRAKTRDGQLQVELAMLEYRLTRGPRATGNADRDSGCGFRGPGETKLETDKRYIKEKIILVKRELDKLRLHREHHRLSRESLGIPIVSLCGYTNAGKSTLMNHFSNANLLAENKLFATLDPTTRKVRIPCTSSAVQHDGQNGREVFLTDTVGFISKLPTSLIAAFRSTLDEVKTADVLIHVIDRSNPSWRKQRLAVLRELDAIKCTDTPIVEFWNKIDVLENPEDIQIEAATLDIEGIIIQDSDSIALFDAELHKEDPIIDEEHISLIENDEDDEAYVQFDVDSIQEDYIQVNSNIIKDRNRAFNEFSSYTKMLKHHPVSRHREKIFVVAGSVKSGIGLNDLYGYILDAININLVSVNIEIPYAKENGLVANIRSVGVVDEIEYLDTSTKLSARVPLSFLPKIRGFRVT